MKQILLSSVKLIKGIVGIADNVADEYILTALQEAQDMGLKRVLGAALTEKLKKLVADDEIGAPENAAYKELADKAQYFLAYTTAAEACMKTTFKLSNLGVAQTGDDNVTPVKIEDVMKVRDDYQAKADAYCKELQGFVLDNQAKYPELDQNTCHAIKAHLIAAYTGGIYLGGARGKIVRRR